MLIGEKGSDLFMKQYKVLEDSYDDIKGATLDTLERNTKRYGLSKIQAIAYYKDELKSIFEENELERIVTLISIGIFAINESCSDEEIISEVKYAIEEIKSNKFDKLLNQEEKKEIINDIDEISKYIK